MESKRLYARSLEEVNAYLDGKHGVEYAPDSEVTYLEDNCVAEFDEEDGQTVCTVYRSADEDEVVETIVVDADGWEGNPDQRVPQRTGEEAKEKARELIAKFASENGDQPTYARVEIRYNDDGDIIEDTIKLSTEEDEEEDDDIFFYADGESEFLSLFDEDNGEDFVVVGISEVW